MRYFIEISITPYNRDRCRIHHTLLDDCPIKINKFNGARCYFSSYREAVSAARNVGKHIKRNGLYGPHDNIEVNVLLDHPMDIEPCDGPIEYQSFDVYSFTFTREED